MRAHNESTDDQRHLAAGDPPAPVRLPGQGSFARPATPEGDIVGIRKPE